jgi:hypothetical protein
VLILSIPNNSLYSLLGYPRKFGIGFDAENFPVKMYKFMKDNDVQNTGSRPFNTYETGGFFIWNFPEKKNFIGGRTIFHKVWDDYTSIINLQQGFESKIDSLNFDYFIWMVPLVNYAQSPHLMGVGILSYLFTKTENWRLVYWDDKSFLFVKNYPIFDQLVLKYEYKYITPFNFYFRKSAIERGFSEEKETVLRELKRKQREDPLGKFQIELRNAYKDRLEE